MSSKPRTSGREESSTLSQQSLNLSAVKKIDDQVVEIKRTASNVVLYKYDGVENKWERSSTEGPLFVFKRKLKPLYGFTILNRLNSENIKELLCPEMELRVELSFVLFKTDTDQIFGLCFPDDCSAQEMGSYLIQMASLSVTDQLDKPEGVAFRSNSAPYLSQTNAPASVNYETVRPLELPTTHSSFALGQVDSDSTKARSMSARHSSGTPVKKTKQNVQLLKPKPHQPMSDSSLITIPVTSASIQQVFSIPYTAPTLSQSSLGLSEKGVSFLQPVQSNPTVSTSSLVSPGSFVSKVTGNGSKGGEDALALSSGSMGGLQSLFSSIELKTAAVHVPAGAFSLAEVEDKLQTDQLSFSGQVVPSPISVPQYRNGQVLMQPSVYAAVLSPIGAQDTLKNDVPVASNKETQSFVLSSADQSGFHFKDIAPRLPDQKSSIFPSIPPLMLSAGMKASPMRGVQNDKEPPQDNKNMKTEVPPLTKAELQKALLHLIEHDDNFLSCIHSAYMQTRSQNLS